jgi:hypothetical protein
LSDANDIRPDLEPPDADELMLLAERLRAARPLPQPAFRGDLGRKLAAGSPRVRARIRILVAAYAGSGTLLLVIGALGAGAGPLA